MAVNREVVTGQEDKLQAGEFFFKPRSKRNAVYITDCVEIDVAEKDIRMKPANVRGSL